MSDNSNNSDEGIDDGKSAGYDEEGKGNSASTSGQAVQEANRASSVSLLRVDHTPPPILIGEGSIFIETDEPFVSHDTQGGAAHQHRHMLSPGRTVQGLKVLDDAGDTIYLDGEADKSSVKIWWNRTVATEQVFIDGSSLTIEADVNLFSIGAQIAHPLGNPPVQRIRRYTHPSTNGRGVEKIEIVKNSTTVFSRSSRLFMVMLWDTSH